MKFSVGVRVKVREDNNCSEISECHSCTKQHGVVNGIRAGNTYPISVAFDKPTHDGGKECTLKEEWLDFERVTELL